MAVGQYSTDGLFSYLAVGREVTFGTAVTATAGLEFLSAGIKGVQQNKILEEIQANRVHSKLIKMGKVVEGDLEFYAKPANTAMAYILQNAFGGAITSATATGETIGGATFQHAFSIGDITANTHTSLTINMRKGSSSTGKIFQYTGMRVNELGITSEIDEALKVSASFMGKDFINSASDMSSFMTATVSDSLSFVNGRVSIENSFASLTSTSYWHVQNVNLTINNNLKGDTESRRIGSDTVDVLPSGIANIQLTMSIRFDTITAIEAMKAGTKLSAQLDWRGNTASGSAIAPGLRFNMPAIYVDEAGDPEVSGPDGQLVSEITFHVLRDDTSATGYAIQGILYNTAATI
jgi:hypothetical protein